MNYLIYRLEYGTVYVSNEAYNKTNTCKPTTQLKKKNITNVVGIFPLVFDLLVFPPGMKLFRILFWNVYLSFPSFF